MHTYELLATYFLRQAQKFKNKRFFISHVAKPYGMPRCQPSLLKCSSRPTVRPTVLLSNNPSGTHYSLHGLLVCLPVPTCKRASSLMSVSLFIPWIPYDGCLTILGVYAWLVSTVYTISKCEEDYE